MLKNRSLEKKKSRKVKKNDFESRFRQEMDNLMRNNPNALVSNEYHRLLNSYNDNFLGISDNKIETVSTENGIQIIRKDRVDSKTAISRIFSEDSGSSKESSFVKSLVFYGLTALIIWIVRQFI